MQEEIVRIEKMAGEGAGLGRINGKVVFVPFTAPGDNVRVEIVSETKSYFKAQIKDMIEPSPDRVEPPCPIFGICGGCAFQHVPYERELGYKQNLIAEIFRHYPARGAAIGNIVPSSGEYGYRNKLTLKLEKSGMDFSVGFYAHKSHYLVPVDECLIAQSVLKSKPGEIGRALDGILTRAAADTEGIEGLILHSSDDSKTVVLTLIQNAKGFSRTDELIREIKTLHPEVTGFFSLKADEKAPRNAFRRKSEEDDPDELPDYTLTRIEGSTPMDRLAGITFEHSPASFFQINQYITEKVIEKIKACVGMSDVKDRQLLDLYAGVGTLSLPVAGLFKEVIAVESDERCVESARHNAASNGVKNYRVISGDAGKALARFAKDNSRGSLPYLILDPPRNGLGGNLVQALPDLDFEKIFYLSCNPHTLARDIDRITQAGRYKLASVDPFDMFPRTFHIECLAVLEKA